MIITHVIYCKRTGVKIGSLDLFITAGTLPYMSNWSETICLHPLFSLSYEKLSIFMQDEWNRLAQLSAEKDIGEDEAENLRVGYLALMYFLGDIKQEVPTLPPLHIVQNTLPGLHTLTAWRHFLESKKFAFPRIVLAKRNRNEHFENMHEYLLACFEVKEAYEKRIVEEVEKEKIRRAQEVLAAMNSIWVTPVSRRMLWRWVRAHLPEKYQPDAEGWLGTLFLGGSAAIVDFEKEDIELAEEIIVSSCPAGTGAMKLVRERLNKILEVWKQEHEAWEVDWESVGEKPIFVNAKKVPLAHPGEEPKPESFENRTKFVQAHARWTIAMKKWKLENPDE
jgi:hypothetical protein